MPDKPITNSREWRWQPTPVNAPQVGLNDLDALTRSAEAIRYSILSIEFWISPSGQLREWLRHNTRLAVVIAIPVFLVLPIVVIGLWQVVSALSALVSVAGKLILLPVLIVIGLIVFSILRWVVKTLI